MIDRDKLIELRTSAEQRYSATTDSMAKIVMELIDQVEELADDVDQVERDVEDIETWRNSR